MASEAPEIMEPQTENLPSVPKKKAELVASDSGYIAPRTMEEAYRYAVAVVDAGLAPDSYKDNYSDRVANPSKVMLGIAASLEAGLPPLYGLRQIAIIGGRPCIWGDAAVALVQSKNLIVNHTRRDIGPSFDPATPVNDWPNEFGVTVSYWRRNQEGAYIGQFTVGDAKRAKLWMNTKKVPWIEHPHRMLFNRARAWALRDGFADALAGLAIREEVEDMAQPEAKAVATKFLEDGDEADATDPQGAAETSGADQGEAQGQTGR